MPCHFTGPKMFWAIKYLGYNKIFGAAQNILAPVKDKAVVDIFCSLG